MARDCQYCCTFVKSPREEMGQALWSFAQSFTPEGLSILPEVQPKPIKAESLWVVPGQLWV
jgi:hypothetical protein